MTYAGVIKALAQMTEEQRNQPVMVRSAEGIFLEVSHSSIDIVTNRFDDRTLYLQLDFHKGFVTEKRIYNR